MSILKCTNGRSLEAKTSTLNIAVLQVGLNHVQTSLFPNIAVTNKELDVKGTLRYISGQSPAHRC